MRKDTEITKDNYWEEYEKVGSSTYEDHWKKHRTMNLAYLAYRILLRAFVIFFIWFPGLIGGLTLITILFYGVNETIPEVSEAAQALLTIDMMPTVALFWLMVGGLMFIVSLAETPIRSLAWRERERNESIFLGKTL